MDVVVLGTGSGDGWPNPFCGCPSCTSERSAGRLRGHTAVLVDKTLLLDCGPETPQAAQRAGLDLTGLRHVLVTRKPPDHSPPAFLRSRSWLGGAALDVLGPPEVVDAYRMWVAPDAPVNFVPVSPGDHIELTPYSLSVLAGGKGSGGASVLYDVVAQDGRLLYAANTGRLPAATLDAVHGAAFDVVFLGERFGDLTTHGADHLDLTTFPEQVRRLRDAGAAVARTDLIAVSLSHHNPPTDELSRRLSAWDARVVDDGTSLGSRPTQPRALRTLVIGGARSGKSREAERLLAAAADVQYVATGYPASDDEEWGERVRLHQTRRPPHWTTIETIDVVSLLAASGGPLLVDCLTLWLTRILDRHDAWDDETWASGAEKAVYDEIDALVAAWCTTTRRVVAVTNEVGQGVVPDTSAGRRFVDVMGRLNARLAAHTEDVMWCVAGRVTRL